MKTALTVAGTDPSGGAGIQADIKTMTANGVFALTAVTALLAQNTTGVKRIRESAPDFLAEQLDCVFTDILPDAVRTGMVSSVPLIEVIADKLEPYHARNIVVDPVMAATSGDRLIAEDALEALRSRLLPLAAVLTPNIPEAEILSGRTIRTPEDMSAARAIGERCGCAVLCKQGRSPGQRRQRPSLAAGEAGALAPLGAGGHPQHPRHRLHPLQRHRLQSGEGLRPGAVGGPGQGIRAWRVVRHAGPGPLDHMFDLHSWFIGRGEG